MNTNESTRRTAGWPVNVRGIIVDYGEVLCQRPGCEQVAWMAQSLGLDLETFKRRYDADRNLYDRGDIHPSDYWARVGAGCPRLTPGLEKQLRAHDVEIWSALDERMLQWLKRLKVSGYKTALLSNMHPDMAVHVRGQFGWLRDFDGVVLSCELHLIKPERRIYEECLELIGLPAEQALFVDDRSVNIEGAKAAGLQTLQFRSVEALATDLGKAGIAPGPV
jgi:putative hydrolase of the HAD superfamily